HGVPRGVLLHLQRAGGDAAGVGGLAGGEDRARFGEDFDGFRGAGHVGALGDDGAAASDQLGGVVAVELVLGGARQRDVARHLPDGAALDVVRAVAPLGVGGDALAAGQFDVLEQLEVDALLVDDVAARVGAGDDGAAELVDLLDGVDRHVPRSRDHDALAVEGLPPGLEDLVGDEHRAVAGGLGADLPAAPAEAFAGQDAGLVAVGDPLVLAEQVADLAPADAGVTGRDVGVLADVPVQLGHERLAEPHDLALGTALGVEVGAAFAAADGQPGERVLEYLLEPEEFHDPQVDRGVEPQAPFVGAEGGVELDAEAAVHLHLAIVVDPGDAEDDLALGLAQAADHGGVGVLGVLGHHGAQAVQDLVHGLVEFDLSGVAAQDFLMDVVQLLVQTRHRIASFRRRRGPSTVSLFRC